jgi:hypothetical protein
MGPQEYRKRSQFSVSCDTAGRWVTRLQIGINLGPTLGYDIEQRSSASWQLQT